MFGFKLILASFSNWCPLGFRNLLSYLVSFLVHNRRLEGKSHVRLLEAPKTHTKKHKKATPGKALNFTEALKEKKMIFTTQFLIRTNSYGLLQYALVTCDITRKISSKFAFIVENHEKRCSLTGRFKLIVELNTAFFQYKLSRAHLFFWPAILHLINTENRLC